MLTIIFAGITGGIITAAAIVCAVAIEVVTHETARLQRLSERIELLSKY